MKVVEVNVKSAIQILLCVLGKYRNLYTPNTIHINCPFCGYEKAIINHIPPDNDYFYCESCGTLIRP